MAQPGSLGTLATLSVPRPHLLLISSKTLIEVYQGMEPDERDGFVIITAASDEGMLAIHDRKPLVLTPELARVWIDPETSAERATEIALEGCRPTEHFHWYKVGKAVGSVKNQGAQLIEPVTSPSDLEE